MSVKGIPQKENKQISQGVSVVGCCLISKPGDDVCMDSHHGFRLQVTSTSLKRYKFPTLFWEDTRVPVAVLSVDGLYAECLLLWGFGLYSLLLECNYLS